MLSAKDPSGISLFHSGITRFVAQYTTPHHNRFMALFPDYAGEPVAEENF